MPEGAGVRRSATDCNQLIMPFAAPTLSSAMGDFRRLEAWQKSRELALDLNRLLRPGSLRANPGLRAQILRAADSIPANLAEGCAKNSRAELARFAETAYGSSKEILNYLILCRDRDAISQQDFDDLFARADRVARLCFGLQRMARDEQRW